MFVIHESMNYAPHQNKGTSALDILNASLFSHHRVHINGAQLLTGVSPYRDTVSLDSNLLASDVFVGR